MKIIQLYRRETSLAPSTPSTSEWLDTAFNPAECDILDLAGEFKARYRLVEVLGDTDEAAA
jgi:hypothetical protein